MRRKLFFITMVSVLAVFLADAAGIPLKTDGLETFIGTEKTYSAKVAAVEKKNGEKYNFTVELQWAEKKKVPAEKVLLTYYGKLEKPWTLWNCTIEFKSTLERAPGRRNPGCFDYDKHLKSRGIGAVARIKNFEITAEPDNPVDKFERRLISEKMKYVETLSEHSKGLISGILFGDVSFLDEEVYENFRNNGTAHVLAVSGLHVGILYGFLQKVLGRKQTKGKALAAAAVLFAFGTLTLWSPSVTRAIGMIGLKIYSQYADKRYDFLSAMSLILLIMMALNPYVIFNVGVQMSFLAAASIAFIMPHIPRAVPDFMAVTLSVTIGLMPYQWFQFNSISMISLIANIPVVYLVEILLPASAVSFLMFCAGAESALLVTVVDAMSAFTVKINGIFSVGTGGLNALPGPPLWLTAAIYMFVFFLASETRCIMMLRREYKKLTAAALGFAVVAMVWGMLTYEPVGRDDAVFVDVGQGDCIHLRDGHTDVLIDGGGKTDYNVGKNILKPYLLKNGRSGLELTIATHKHTDHYKGLEELAEDGMIEDLREELTAGKIFAVSPNIRIETLWPLEIDKKAGQEENSRCSVFMVHYKNRKILITGDLDSKGEAEMLDFYKGTGALKADILNPLIAI